MVAKCLPRFAHVRKLVFKAPDDRSRSFPFDYKFIGAWNLETATEQFRTLLFPSYGARYFSPVYDEKLCKGRDFFR